MSFLGIAACADGYTVEVEAWVPSVHRGFDGPPVVQGLPQADLPQRRMAPKACGKGSPFFFIPGMCGVFSITWMISLRGHNAARFSSTVGRNER